jgi:predicted MFS family arabinose efflux permease
LGIPIGTLLGLGLGGVLAQIYGWRAVFLIAAAPGLVVALVMMLTVREPRRGTFDVAVESQPAGQGAAMRSLFRLKSYRLIVAGATLQGFAAYGQALWLPSYLSRSFQLNLAEIGVSLGLIAGLAGGAGTLFGGWLGDRMGARDVRWYMWLCALALAVSAPLSVGVLLAPSPAFALTFLCGTSFLVGMFFGPGYAIIQFLAAPAVRALAMAAMFFVVNLLGMGLGPQLVGLLSDALAASRGAESLRYAMLLIVGAKALAALYYWRASFFLTRETLGGPVPVRPAPRLNPAPEAANG